MKRIRKFSVTVRQHKGNQVSLYPFKGETRYWGQLANDGILPVKEKDKNKYGEAKPGLYRITVTPDKNGDWQIQRDLHGHIQLARLFVQGRLLVCETSTIELLNSVKDAGQVWEYLDYEDAFRTKISVNKIKIPKKKRGL